VNLEKCFFRDVHNLLSEKKIVTSFFWEGNPSRLGFLLLGIFVVWNLELGGGGGGGVVVVEGGGKGGGGLGW